LNIFNNVTVGNREDLEGNPLKTAIYVLEFFVNISNEFPLYLYHCDYHFVHFITSTNNNLLRWEYLAFIFLKFRGMLLKI